MQTMTASERLSGSWKSNNHPGPCEIHIVHIVHSSLPTIFSFFPYKQESTQDTKIHNPLPQKKKGCDYQRKKKTKYPRCHWQTL